MRFRDFRLQDFEGSLDVTRTQLFFLVRRQVAIAQYVSDCLSSKRAVDSHHFGHWWHRGDLNNRNADFFYF